MRRSTVIASLAALAIPALTILGAGTALASDTAPAPDCQSFSSQFFCNSGAPVNPISWTQQIVVNGIPDTPATFSGPPSIQGGCQRFALYLYSYSYVSDGVTFVSPVTHFNCVVTLPR